ncbi:HNH endonuclease signature motif containing protein [Bradyrhizobium embrapense]|uniref:HNH endonuclease signature motif containing protein n=1 Tax=Bradyrhizobium embrapense TaxID=630921 RepID=UPI0007C56388|nr:HNH endonuclease [Bradyrhizobium embrapense]
MGAPNTEKVKRYRIRTAMRMRDSLGGKCQTCGYDRCQEALEIHHLDPSKKEFSFSQFRAAPRSLQVLVAELKKCILLCANCHREVHAGLRDCPSQSSFDEAKFWVDPYIARGLPIPKGSNPRVMPAEPIAA